MNIFSRFLKDESGATAIEYGLLAALIAVAVIAGAQTVGEQVDGLFETVTDCLEDSVDDTVTDKTACKT